VLPVAETPWGIVVAGVGGTGVITIGQLLGMAAHLEGKGIVTQDSAGLAQKGGATWSHIQIASRPEAILTSKVGTAEADLVIGCDPIVTAGKATLAVMREGVIQQIGTPQDIYNEPKNAFVADFIGESNILPGMMAQDYLVRFCSKNFTCVDAGFGTEQAVDVVVRPEDVDIIAPERVNGNGMLGIVKSVLFMGVHYEIQVVSDEFTWRVHTTDAVNVGERVGLEILPDAIHIMRKPV
jgi:hypothetical protein